MMMLYYYNHNIQNGNGRKMTGRMVCELFFWVLLLFTLGVQKVCGSGSRVRIVIHTT